MIDVSVIIVNFNTETLTRDCLTSVFRETKEVAFDVWVVDNHSTDGSVAMIRNEFPRVNLVINDRNLGFGAANNVAMRRSRARYFCLLNSDTVLLNNAVKLFFDFAEQRIGPPLGAAGVELLAPDLTTTRFNCGFHTIPAELRGRFRYLLRETLILLCLRRLFSGLKIRMKKVFRKDSGGHRHAVCPREVDWLTGTAMFIPRAVIDAVGMFDESFFMYSEEVDLEYRMAKSGFHNMLIDGPRIVHYSGGSFKNAAAPAECARPLNRKRIWFNLGKLMFFDKHSSGPGVLVYVTLMLASVMYEMLLDLFRREYTFAEHVKFMKQFAKRSYR